MTIDTIIFDLDGIIIETEELWNQVRYKFAVTHGGHWGEGDQRLVMGANSMEWAASMRENNGVQLSDQAIYDGIIGALREEYARRLPLIPGAVEAVTGLAPDYRLGVASSSPLELIEYALELAGIRAAFACVLSSDDVGRGKPAPDVYLEACARLGGAPARSAAVEDSSNGIRAADAAGLAVIAIPNAEFPPASEALGLADVVLGSIKELDGALVRSLRSGERKVIDNGGEGTSGRVRPGTVLGGGGSFDRPQQVRQHHVP
jgi:HAD superfamily hydrolase (TIGR01509 family)